MSRITQKPVRVLVTGVGAIIGQGVVKSLRHSNLAVVVIGLDKKITPYARSLCDLCVEKPAVAEESDAYLQFWGKLIEDLQIDLVIPALEIDVFYLDKHQKQLTSTCLALNNSSLIRLTQDKWQMAEFLHQESIGWIPSVLPATWQDCLSALGAPPYILKPRAGNGSRGIVQLDDLADFTYWTQKVSYSFLVQQKIGSDDAEYTAAAFGLGDGHSLAPIIFRRTLSVAGNTQYAEVCQEPGICSMITALSKLLCPIGPTNYQFRKHLGSWYLLEINPRISSSNSLRTAFGYNEAAMCIAFYLHQRRPSDVTVTEGRGWRYAEDFVQ
jgi:carbamoyl-phosphate synthase large subunit